MKTAIVILNWNTKDFLEKYLPGLISSTKDVEGTEVIVVDNASTDGSVEFLKDKVPDIKTIVLDSNYGYTGGYNKGLEQIRAEYSPEYYILMNSDIEVSAGWLEPMVNWMDSHPECGACAPKIHNINQRDTFDYAGAAGGHIDIFGYPFCRGRLLDVLEKDFGQYDTLVKDVFWVSGACFMVRTELFHELGGFDERFFAHMEEIDLCWRMQLEGQKVQVVTDSVVYHLGGGTLPASSPYKLYLNFRNNLLMLNNNLAKTLALSRLKKGASTTSAAKYGVRESKALIRVRMCLDDLYAAFCLLTLRFKLFNSIRNSHIDYKKNKRRTNMREVANYLEKHMDTTVKGIYEKGILLQRLLDGKEIFAKMHKVDFTNY